MYIRKLYLASAVPRKYMYVIESVLLHFTINDYMTVTCGLRLIFSLEKIKEVEREMFQLCNYLPAYYITLTEITRVLHFIKSA